jgi:glutamate formiminotransferase
MINYLATDITIGFEKDYLVFENRTMLEVCLRYYNPPLYRSMEDTKLQASRYEIKVEYKSLNGSAGTWFS